MRPDREMAVKAFQNMGWTAKREKRGKTPVWKFSRADTGGLWDTFTVRQDCLSMHTVAEKAMQYGDADDLLREIMELKEKWLKSRFLGIYSRAALAREGE